MDRNLSAQQFGANEQILGSHSPFILGTQGFFREIDVSRPYEPMGMSTEKWGDVEIREVELDDLIGGQYELSANRVAYSARDIYNADHGGDQYPLVVMHEGRPYLEDGHHRVAAAKSLGMDTIKARVYEP